MEGTSSGLKTITRPSRPSIEEPLFYTDSFRFVLLISSFNVGTKTGKDWQGRAGSYAEGRTFTHSEDEGYGIHFEIPSLFPLRFLGQEFRKSYLPSGPAAVAVSQWFRADDEKEMKGLESRHAVDYFRLVTVVEHERLLSQSTP